MYKTNGSLTKHIDFLLLDLLSLSFSFVLAFYIRSNSKDFIESGNYLNILFWMIVPLIFYYILFNPYKDILKRSHLIEIKISFINSTVSFLFLLIIFYFLQISIFYSRLVIIYTYILYFFLSVLIRIAWKELLLKGIIKTETKSVNNLLIICKKEDSNDILLNIRNSDYGKYTIKGFYFPKYKETKAENTEDLKTIRIDEIYDFVIDNNINTVFITTSLNNSENKIIKGLILEGVEIQLFIDSIFGIEAEDKEISNVGMYNSLQINSYVFTPAQKLYFVFKRFIDIIVSAVGVTATMFFYFIIKVLYLFSGDDYPIIYTQKRIGLNGSEFKLYKFRSMVSNADEVLKDLLKDEKLKEEWNKNQKLDNDPRITKIGSFLRKTSLDELPQFINVLKGEMSLIGPRPLVPGELKSKNGIKLYEKVKPGITGWWACNGRSDMSYEERLEHEYYYVKNCSLYLDLLCVLRTIYVVIFCKGAK